MKVLHIEHDARAAVFIVKRLTQSGCVVEHAGDGEEGLSYALSETYDAAIVGIMLPPRDGLSVIGELRRRNVQFPVLVLSAKREVDDRVRGLQAGGDDYLTRPFAFSELLARLQTLVRRASCISEPTCLRVGDLTLDIVSRNVEREATDIELQPREFSLLEYLMRKAGRVVSRTMIQEDVRDYTSDPQTNVVEARIRRLRDKVDHPFAYPLIHTIGGSAMFSKTSVNWFRTVAFRLTAVYAALFAIASLAVFSLTLWAVSGNLRSSLDEDLRRPRHVCGRVPGEGSGRPPWRVPSGLLRRWH